MLDIWLWLNVASCGVMFVYVAYAATVMPKRGMWVRRLTVWLLAFCLGCQVAAPWAPWLPNPVWHGVILHATVAVMLVIWRHEVFALIGHKFSPENDEQHPLRRLTDYA